MTALDTADRVLFLADGAIVEDLPEPRGAEQIATRMAALS